MTEEVSTPHAAYVLVVDDDEGILRLARKSLERAGCRVAICAGVEAARERLASGSPDLLVLDYQLSGPETGLDFFRRLRAEGVRIPAILVTGFTDESRVIEALRAGVSDVVPKSGDYLDYLPEAVERVLSQVRLQRASDEALLLRDREAALPHVVGSVAAPRADLQRGGRLRFSVEAVVRLHGPRMQQLRTVSRGSTPCIRTIAKRVRRSWLKAVREPGRRLPARDADSPPRRRIPLVRRARGGDARRRSATSPNGSAVARTFIRSARRSRSASGCWRRSRPRARPPKKRTARKTAFSRCCRTNCARRSRRCWPAPACWR